MIIKCKVCKKDTVVPDAYKLSEVTCVSCRLKHGSVVRNH